jgi:hypothetical protein
MPMEARCCTNAADNMSESVVKILIPYLRSQPHTPELIKVIRKLMELNPAFGALLDMFIKELPE